LSIHGKSSTTEGIEFICEEDFNWIEGRYEIIIKGWFMRGEMKEKSRFFIDIDKENATKLAELDICVDESGSVDQPIKAKSFQIPIKYS